ncbi:MAG: carboxymuconolactone decarboxylase family protein [Candidatus Omnitrophica bacterium]|nr:carboxymuconolactone decarboxylase family protein [Candidatus Omnitrophota bacterium]
MYPEQIQDKLIDVGSMVLKTGYLNIKTKALIGLSTAVATYCAHCHYQTKSLARKFGATELEIEEAENIALRMRQKCHIESRLFSLNEN